jgi:hypothetical protein
MGPGLLGPWAEDRASSTLQEKAKAEVSVLLPLLEAGANAGSRTRINSFGGYYTIHCATFAGSREGAFAGGGPSSSWFCGRPGKPLKRGRCGERGGIPKPGFSRRERRNRPWPDPSLTSYLSRDPAVFPTRSNQSGFTAERQGPQRNPPGMFHLLVLCALRV